MGHSRVKRKGSLRKDISVAEALEARLMLAIFTVTNTSDTGVGSFRQAMADANAASTADTIAFDTAGIFATPQTISLLSALPIVSAGGGVLTINGTGPTNLTIQRHPSAATSFRIFDSTAPELHLKGFQLSGGVVSGTQDGAGIQAGGFLDLDQMVISGNQTGSTGDGGAIRINQDGALAVRNSTISGNTGRRGAGIYFYTSGTLVLENSTVSGNTGLGGGIGGGIYFFSTASASPPPGFTASTLVVRNSTINNNTTPGAGGGIVLQSFVGTLLVENSTITGNSALTGGGIGQAGSGSGSIVVRDSTVSGNTATGTGAGQGGGGIARTSNVAGTITVVNSVVSGNTNSVAPDILTSAPTTTQVNFSAIGSNTGFILSASSGNNLPFGTNLMLGALANNGGATQTMLPQPGSPLINAGSNAAVPAGLTTDQRGAGFARINGAVVDIGSVETQVTGNPIASASSNNVTNPGGTAQPVLVVYSDPNGSNNGLNVSTIIGNNSAVRVLGPGGFDAPANYVSINNATNGTPRTANYTFTPPGGSWDAADNGSYIIVMQANQVRDLDGNAVATGVIGSFSVSLPRFITVTNINDSGAGSLRDAIIQSNAFPTNDIIVFDPAVFETAPQTITALSPLPNVTAAGGDFILQGSGSTRVKVQIGPSGVIPRAITFDTPRVNISGVTFQGTGAPGSGGGLLFNAVGGDVTLTDVQLIANVSPVSGAALHLNTNTALTVRNSTISGNSTNNSGGGIYFFQGGSLVLENSTISGNTANGNNGGGGIYFFGDAIANPPAGHTPRTLLIRNSTIDHNTSGGVGGGISLLEFEGTLVVQNSTMVANTAGTSGGGIAMSGGDGSIAVGNSTISLNAANGTLEGLGGGGISRVGANGFINVTNSVVSGNLGQRPDINALFGVTINVNSSAIGSSDGFVMSPSSGNNLPFGANLLLGALGNNGGPTQTIAPQPGSPLINAGSNALVPIGLSNDQRGPGFARISGPVVDIGALEVDAIRPTVSSAQFRFQTGPQAMIWIASDDAGAAVLGNPYFRISNVSNPPPGMKVGAASTPVPDDKLHAEFNPATNTITVTFPGYPNGILPDGDYEAVLLADGVTDASGNHLAQDHVTPFFVLTGDLNRDRQVSIADFIDLAANFGKTGAVYSDGDLNYDGTVSISDFIDLASKFGTSLGPVLAAMPAQSAAGEEILAASSTPEVSAVLEAEQHNGRKSHSKRHEALPPRRLERHHRGRPLLRLLARRSDNS